MPEEERLQLELETLREDLETLRNDFEEDKSDIDGFVPDGINHNVELFRRGIFKRIQIDDTSYTAELTDFFVGISSTDTTVTIILPPAADAGIGKVIIINDESGAAGTNNITVDGNDTEHIDDTTTQAISTNFGSLRLYSTGSAWHTF